MIEKQIGNLTELTAENGYIHKIGTDTYVKSIIILSSDTIDNYEEVASIPPYTKEEYDKKVAELVRERYTESEEFAIQRKMINVMLTPATVYSFGNDNIVAEYNAYNYYVNECKDKAGDLLIKEKENGEES